MLGWDIETAYEAGLAGKHDDVDLLVHARQNNRIYVTFDELKGQQGPRVARELRRNGGKIVQIRGGADKDKYRITGKLLFHYPDWYPFLTTKNGVSVIADIKKDCVNYTPKQWHQKFHKVDANQFTPYIIRRSQRPYRPRPRKRKPPPSEQGLLK